MRNMNNTKLKTKVEHGGAKTPTAYNIQGFYLECQNCGKKIVGQTEDEVMHNFRIHDMTHEKEELKI